MQNQESAILNTGIAPKGYWKRGYNLLKVARVDYDLQKDIL